MQTKDIISILGVTNNLLRYYEDQGVIHPVRESNGYRSYQKNDIVALLEGLRYARFGFPVAQIPAFVNETKEEQKKQLSQQLDVRKKEMMLMQLENQIMEKRIHDLECLETNMNHFHKETLKDKILLPYRSYSHNHEFNCDDPDGFSAWVQKVSLIESFLYFSMESFMQEKYESGMWCLAVDKNTAEISQEPVFQQGIHIPSMQMLSTYVEIENDNPKMFLDRLHECINDVTEKNISTGDTVLVRLFLQNNTTATVQVLIEISDEDVMKKTVVQ